MHTATTTDKRKVALTNITGMFKGEVFDIFYSGYIEEMLTTLNLLYKNIFIYPIPTSSINVLDGFDYNTLNYNDRYAINEVCDLIEIVLKTALKYDFTHFNEMPIVLTTKEAKTITHLFDSLTYDKDVYIKLLDEMIITSVLYKPIILEANVSMETVSMYFFCKQIKAVFKGYIGTYERLLD